MPQEIFCDMKEMLGDSAPAYSTVTTWHAEFKRDRSLCDDLHRCGWLATSVNEETVKSQQTCHEWLTTVSVIHCWVCLPSLLVVHIWSWWRICWWRRCLHDGCHGCYATLRRQIELTHQQVYSACSTRIPAKFISRFLTLDEIWLHSFDPESKMQSMAWKYASSPPPRKFCVVASAHKVIATVFWDAEEIVVTDSLEHGSTIRGIYYADLIRNAWAALKEKRLGKLRHGMLFHQDNAPAHVISSTGCHTKRRIRTTPSSTVFVRLGLGPKRLLLVS